MQAEKNFKKEEFKQYYSYVQNYKMLSKYISFLEAKYFFRFWGDDL